MTPRDLSSRLLGLLFWLVEDLLVVGLVIGTAPMMA